MGWDGEYKDFELKNIEGPEPKSWLNTIISIPGDIKYFFVNDKRPWHEKMCCSLPRPYNNYFMYIHIEFHFCRILDLDFVCLDD